jgi:peroxiredoxin
MNLKKIQSPAEPSIFIYYICIRVLMYIPIKPYKNYVMNAKFKHLCSFLPLVMLMSCSQPKQTQAYLHEVLENLKTISSATYYTEHESYQPGDSVPSSTYRRLIKEYDNPLDTTIGASLVWLDAKDTTRLEYGYDGKVRILVDHERRRVAIDDFTARPLPFRLVSPPFFNYAKNIIEYILTTQDSISVEREEGETDTHIRLVIHEDKQVEFCGKAVYMPDSPLYTEPTSVYELWISKSDNLPYKIRREMSHDISVRTCSEVKFNNLNLAEFNVYDYIPDNYEIVPYKLGNTPKPTSDLVDKKAPDWVLNDMNEQPATLRDFKSKVLLINFTGIGCGPCQAAIPFLKELKNRYAKDDVELIAIETWSRTPSSLRIYANRKELNYRLFCGTDEVIKSYQTGNAAPVFFILDENRTIRKVIQGYSKGTVDKEITDAIEKLL